MKENKIKLYQPFTPQQMLAQIFSESHSMTPGGGTQQMLGQMSPGSQQQMLAQTYPGSQSMTQVGGEVSLHLKKVQAQTPGPSVWTLASNPENKRVSSYFLFIFQYYLLLIC